MLDTDLSRVQDRASPELWASKPENVELMVHNAESEWYLGDRKFDFVHGRMVMMGIRDWPAYFKRAWGCALSGRLD